MAAQTVCVALDTKALNWAVLTLTGETSHSHSELPKKMNLRHGSGRKLSYGTFRRKPFSRLV